MTNGWERMAFGDAGVVTDPYFEWAKRTDYAYTATPPDGLVPVIIELARKKTTAERFAKGLDWTPPDGREHWKQWLRIPSVYAKPSAGLADTRFCTAVVTPEFFLQLRRNASLRSLVMRYQVGLPIIGLTDNRPPQPLPIVSGSPVAATVVTGIIDDALAFAHERFRESAGGTRMRYFWDQDPRWDVIGTVPPADHPVLFGYGNELRKRSSPGFRGIDDRMMDATHAGLVDEDDVYRATSHLDYRQRGHLQAALRLAHGTHVMDLACGEDPSTALPSRPIIGVQLPGGTTRDTSGSTLGVHVVDGLRYILERADRIANTQGGIPLPVVVNLSYGLVAGPHDASSVLEAAIDDLVSTRNNALPVAMRVVLPAGNSHLARCHARFSLPGAGSRQRLDWRVQPDDATPSFLEVWLPRAVAQPVRARIRITTPNGDVSPWIYEGGVYVFQPGANALCVAHYLSAASTGTRAMILISLAPTTTHRPNWDVAFSGTWRIAIENRGPAAPILVDAWIQRDDTPYGYPVSGRQSRFDDRAYRHRDDAGREIEIDSGPSYIRRDGSMSSIATGGEPVVIGGFCRSNLALDKKSAGGPVARPPGGGLPATDSPDALTVNEDSVACRGVLAAGSRSGSTVAMDGTSVSAPQITRWIAGEIAAGRPGNRAAVRLQAQTPPIGIPSASPPALPQIRAGAGRILLPPVRGARRGPR